MKILLAIDPGPHTGVAFFTDGRFSHAETIDVDEYTEVGQFHRLLEMLNLLAAEDPHTEVVIEAFRTVQPGVAASSAGVATQELIGFIRGNALLAGLTVTMQMPSVRKPYEDEAKKLPHATVHETSATAHGLCRLATLRGVRMQIDPEEEEDSSQPAISHTGTTPAPKSQPEAK